MLSIDISPDDTTAHSCPCCGQLEHTIIGWVRENDEPAGAYQVRWAEESPRGDRHAHMGVTLGTMLDTDSVSVQVIISIDGEDIVFGVIDAEGPEPLWGRPLTVQQANALPDVDRLWAFIDYACENDPRMHLLMNWMDAEPVEVITDDEC